MTVFIALASVLTLLVVGWLLRPLLRQHQPSEVSSDALNVAIYREQLDALDADLARGAIGAQEHESARDELQLRMLDDVQDGAPPVRMPPGRSVVPAIVVALSVTVGSLGLYRWWGSPSAIDPAARQVAQQKQVSDMVEALAQRLKANPDNPQGWAMLARSYKVMGRLDDALAAYRNTGNLLETEPDLMADYADLLAVRAGDELSGEPMVLVRKALAINPKHPMSLMLVAAQSYREGNYKLAIGHWETLLSTLDPQSPDAEQISAYIAQAQAKSGGSSAQPQASAPSGTPDNAQILQMVERLATRLKSNPNDLEGWARLARSYKVLGRMQEAQEAYAKAGNVVDRSPDMLTDYADLMATLAGGNLEGRPLKLVDQALGLQPRHPMALMLSGTAAYRRGEFALAIQQWEKLESVVQPGSSEAQWVAKSLADARARAGTQR